MQVFVPYPSPLEVAECLDKQRLRVQIIECDKILKAISGESQAWKNHPVVKMYSDYAAWLWYYRGVLEAYSRRNIRTACEASRNAYIVRPPFLTSDFCDQHKRRLFTKAPELYPQFWSYGESDENWYFVDGQIVKYINGKRI